MPEKKFKANSISCPECGSKISSELADLIMQGNNAYCENCGFPFRGIDPEKGEVKPLIKSDYKKKDSGEKKLSKEEKQWIAWKSEFNRWKNIVKDEFTGQKKKWKAKKQQERQENKELRQQMRENNKTIIESQKNKVKNSISQHLTPSKKPEEKTKKTVIIEKSPKKIAEIEHGFNTALDVLVQLTPFYYAFIFIMTIVSMFTNGTTGVFYALGSIVIEGFVISYDLKTIIPSEKEGKVEHVGIPMIIVGTFTLHSFGVGVFILARGILHLVKFIRLTKLNNCSHLWKREIVKSITLVLKPLTLVYLFSAIFTQIGEAIDLSAGSVGYLMYIIISGSIIITILIIRIFPSIKKNNVENFPEDKAIILIIVGALSLSYGMGVLLLILGISFIDLRKSENKIDKKFPKEIDIGKLRYHLVSKGKKREESGDQDKSSDQGRKPRRFDPNTGKPLGFITTISESPQKTTSTEESIRDDKYFSEDKRIFTVLEPDVRRRLLDMQIEEEDKNEVAKSFIYLTYEKQLKYLDELERVNKKFDEKNLVMLRRIYALPISEKQHKFLADQLDYLPENSQEEFVSFLEQTVN